MPRRPQETRAALCPKPQLGMVMVVGHCGWRLRTIGVGQIGRDECQVFDKRNTENSRESYETEPCSSTRRRVACATSASDKSRSTSLCADMLVHSTSREVALHAAYRLRSKFGEGVNAHRSVPSVRPSPSEPSATIRTPTSRCSGLSCFASYPSIAMAHPTVRFIGHVRQVRGPMTPHCPMRGGKDQHRSEHGPDKLVGFFRASRPAEM